MSCSISPYHPLSFHVILVGLYLGVPRSWNILIPNILSDIISQLIINQQGFWTLIRLPEGHPQQIEDDRSLDVELSSDKGPLWARREINEMAVVYVFLGKYRKIICKYESSILTDWVWFKCVWDILRSIIHWDSSKMTFKTIQISEILWNWPRIEPTLRWGVSWRVNAQLEPPANCWKEDHTQCVAQHLIPKLLSNTRHQIHSLA